MKNPNVPPLVLAAFDRYMQHGPGASLDPPGYAERVLELEAEGMCTSDAQAVADVEFGLA